MPAFVDRMEEYEDDVLANCRGGGQFRATNATIQRNNRHEPVSYSRSFDQTGFKLRQQQQQQLQLLRERRQGKRRTSE